MTKLRTSRLLLSVLAVVVIVHLIESVILVGTLYILDRQARATLSVRLGIEPSWVNFETYIADHFQLGMNRNQILRQATNIGAFTIEPYYIGEAYCEGYYFNVGPFQTTRGGRWDICFDENNTVTLVKRYRNQ